MPTPAAGVSKETLLGRFVELAAKSKIKSGVVHGATILLCERWQTLATEAHRLLKVNLGNVKKTLRALKASGKHTPDLDHVFNYSV